MNFYFILIVFYISNITNETKYKSAKAFELESPKGENVVKNKPQSSDDTYERNPYNNFLENSSDEENKENILLPDQLNYQLPTLNNWENILSSLKQDSKKSPRKISFFGGRDKEDAEEKGIKKFNKKNKANVKSKENIKTYNSENKKFKPNKSIKKFDNLKQNTGFHRSFLHLDNMSCNQISGCSDPDLSCCQHCSEHQDKSVLGNSALKLKYKPQTNKYNTDELGTSKSNSRYLQNSANNLKKTNNRKSYQSFQQKYPVDNELDEDKDEDEDDEDEDDMFKIKNSKASLNEAGNLNYSLNHNHHFQRLNDQFDKTKNNLSHEANYKLSKNEQDAAEKKKDFSWNWGIFKRSYKFNPMNEIKLKTSSRLMKKGYGASLPSYSLGETRQDLMISKTLREKEQEILRENQRKCAIKDDSMEKFQRDFDDVLKEVPLEQDFSLKPKDILNSNSKKRVSDSKMRFKRELVKEIKDINKARKEFYRIENTNSSTSCPSLKIEKSIKALNIASDMNLLSVPQVNKNAIFQNICDFQHLQRRKYSLDSKDLKAFQVDETQKLLIDGISNSSKFLPKHKLKNSKKSQNIEKAFTTSKALLTIKDDHLRVSVSSNRFKRLKTSRSINIENSKEKLTNLPKTVNVFIPEQRLAKHLKRFKRFNPSSTLQLKIYQKFNRPNALTFHKNKKRPRRNHKTHFERKRYKRDLALNCKPLKNSAGQNNNLFQVFTRILFQKAVTIQSYFDSFIKKYWKLWGIGNGAYEMLNKPRNTIKQDSFKNTLNISKPFVNTINNRLKKDHIFSLFQSQKSPENFMDRGFNSSNLENQVSYLSSNYSSNLKNFAEKSSLKASKRSKRSMDFDFYENQLSSDKMQNFNKKTYSPQSEDLYKKSHYKMDFPKRKETELTNLQRKNNEIFPDFLSEPKTFTNLNFENNQPDFNLEDFYKFQHKNYPKNINSVFKYNRPKKLLKTSKNLHNYNIYPQKYFKRENSNELSIKPSNIKSNQILNDFPNKVQKLKEHYLNDLQNFNHNYKFNENHFNWPNLKTYIENSSETITTNSNTPNISSELRNEILNCKAFSSLEDFLKSLPKNITDHLFKNIMETTTDALSLNQIEMNINNTNILDIDKTTLAGPTVLDSTVNCLSTTEISANTNNSAITEAVINAEASEEPEICTEDYEETPIDTEFNMGTLEPITETVQAANFTTVATTSLQSVVEAGTETDNQLSSSTDKCDVKLNITINANVQGNSHTNQYCGNGSFRVIPGLEEDDRKRRGILKSPLENLEKSESGKILMQKPYHLENHDDYSDIISGKFSSSLVSSILNTVRDTPHLKELWPSLQHNEPNKRADTPNFYAIRNQQNEFQLQDSEKLLAKVMSSINSIIEEQARSHVCVPLSPDLQQFYNMILKFRRDQDDSVRDKRHLHKIKNQEVFSYSHDLIDPYRVEKQTKKVTKLLECYNMLPQDNQKKIVVMRDDLLRNILRLHQLLGESNKEVVEEKLKRQLDPIKNEVLQAGVVESFVNDLGIQYSTKYLKLLKAAKLKKGTK